LQTQEQWKKDRQTTITASDATFILKEFGNEKIREKLKNVNTYNKTRFQFYMEKTLSFEKLEEVNEIMTKVKPDNAKKMQEGNDREAEIGERAKQDLELDIEPNGHNMICLENRELGATPDYYIKSINAKFYDKLYEKLAKEGLTEQVVIEGYREDIFEDLMLEEGILECKLTAPINETSIILAKKNNSDKFTDLSDEEIKQILWDEKVLGYTLQVQQQLLCTKKDWAVIAVAIKEEDKAGSEIVKMHYEFVEANPKIHKVLIEAGKNAWKWLNDIEEGKISPPTHDKDNVKDCVYYYRIEADLQETTLSWVRANLSWNEWKNQEDALKECIKVLYGNTKQNIEVQEDSGQKYAITITPTKGTTWTEESKNKAIEDAKKKLAELEALEIGSIKTPSQCRLKLNTLNS
jgi:hypothetical protein